MSNTDAMADLFDVRELYDEVVRTIQRYSSTHDMSESGLGPEAMRGHSLPLPCMAFITLPSGTKTKRMGSSNTCWRTGRRRN